MESFPWSSEKREVVDFNALPAETKVGLAASLKGTGPVSSLLQHLEPSVPFRNRWGVALVGGLLLALAEVGCDFGSCEHPIHLQWDSVLWLGFAVLLIGLAVVRIAWCSLLFRLPLPPGRYLFADCLISVEGPVDGPPVRGARGALVNGNRSTNSEMIWVWRMADLADAQHEGRFLTLYFADGAVEGLLEPDPAAAQRIVAALRRDGPHDAAVQSLAPLAARTEPGGASPVGVPTIQRLPAWALRPMTAAVLATLALTAALWLAHAVLNDSAAWGEARQRDVEDVYRAYIANGGWRAETARAEIPESRYRHAAADRSVPGLRVALDRLPDSDARFRAAVVAAYSSARSQAQARAQDAAASNDVVCWNSFLSAAEAAGGRIGFFVHLPDEHAMATNDRIVRNVLRDQPDRVAASLSRQFVIRADVQRSVIQEALSAAFRKALAAELFQLDPHAPRDGPTLDVSCEIELKDLLTMTTGFSRYSWPVYDMSLTLELSGDGGARLCTLSETTAAPSTFQFPESTGRLPEGPPRDDVVYRSLNTKAAAEAAERIVQRLLGKGGQP